MRRTATDGSAGWKSRKEYFNMRSSQTQKLVQMVQLAILVALVIVLQLVGSFIHIGPTSISLVLIPIALGGMIFGPVVGGFLGLIFGIMTLVAGITGTDGFTYTLFSIQPMATTVICLGKATLAGLCGGLVFKALKKHNRWAATLCAAAIVPIVNTGLFILGGLTLVKDTLNASFVAEGTTLVYFLFIVCAGVNFLGEFGFNMILSPALYRLSLILTKKTDRPSEEPAEEDETTEQPVSEEPAEEEKNQNEE